MISLPWRRTRRTSVPARLTAAAIFGTAASVAVLVATDVVAVPTWAIPGVDVASHQHPGASAIDWQAVADSGQKFAFIKATESTHYTNPHFSSDSLKAQQAGVMPGSYHYARPGTTDARSEARFYASVLATGPQPSLPPTLDLEESGGLSPTELQNWVRDWIDEIKIQTGREPIIYTFYNFWINYMDNTTEFSEYPLWLAYYSDSLPDVIPGGWDEATFWQYSDSGSVPGIVTTVDMNEYHGTDFQLQALAEDMPADSNAGRVANILEGAQGVVDTEAELANAVEHATGVEMPITSDFLVQLLGVIGGRLEPEVLINSGLTQLIGPVAQDIAGSVGGDPADIANSVDLQAELMPAISALAGAVGEAQNNGDFPIEILQNLAGSVEDVDTVRLGEVLQMLQVFGGTSDWAAKLETGDLTVDPDALEGLVRATQ